MEPRSSLSSSSSVSSSTSSSILYQGNSISSRSSDQSHGGNGISGFPASKLPAPQPRPSPGRSQVALPPSSFHLSAIGHNLNNRPESLVLSSSPSSQSSLTSKAINSAAATGVKIRRALAGKKKKEESSMQEQVPHSSQQQGPPAFARRARAIMGTPQAPPPPPPPPSSMPTGPSLTKVSSRTPSITHTKHQLSSLFSRKKSSQPQLADIAPPSISSSPSTTPPPVPPKPAELLPATVKNRAHQEPPPTAPNMPQASSSFPAASSPSASPFSGAAAAPPSAMPTSFSTGAIINSPASPSSMNNNTLRPSREPASSPTTAEERAAWRRSDSTIGHHTIRPGSGVGTRTPRPVSVAESTQSTHTIVPSNKRLSALITDAGFATPEEDPLHDTDNDDDDSDSGDRGEGAYRPASSHGRSTSSSASNLQTPVKAHNRRSLSVGTAPYYAKFSSGNNNKAADLEFFSSSSTVSSSSLSSFSSSTNTDPRAAAASASRSVSEHHHHHQLYQHHRLPPTPPAQDMPTLSKTAANGYIMPSSPSSSVSTSSMSSSDASGGDAAATASPAGVRSRSPGAVYNIRGRLAAAMSIASPGPSPASTSSLPIHAGTAAGSSSQTSLVSSPAKHHQRQNQHPAPPPAAPSTPPRSHARTAAISITNGLSPAAGLAKRAVERMGRVWGGIGTSSSSSVHSSSSTTSSSSAAGVGTPPPPSSFDRAAGGNGGGGGSSNPFSKRRRTPGGHSGGSWSISSLHGASASASSLGAGDADAFMQPDGPRIGRRLRGPLRAKSSGAAVVGGVVFGQDLQRCVDATRVVRVLDRPIQCENEDKKGGEEERRTLRERMAELEERELPAIVVRCAQHLMTWGVHEEGLFRLNGRPAHVAKLRSEFDTGADFDMVECGLGDLDPHAVSSIFKAYLRELPEVILTRVLSPIFEAAVAAEKDTTAAPNAEESSWSMNSPIKRAGPGLPSSPRVAGLPALRKPPSLSTFAMPNMAVAKPPSEQLLKALRGLIAQLPPANRDLLKTLTELIMLTAAHSAETKMPLHNLLLVFCPSVGMNPSLLRTLCEAPGMVWEGLSSTRSRSSIQQQEAEGDQREEDNGQRNDARFGSVEPRQGKRHIRDLSTPIMLVSTSSSSSSSSPSTRSSAAVIGGRSRAMTTGPRVDAQARATMSSIYLDALENPAMSRSSSSATTDTSTTGTSLYLSIPPTPAGESSSRTPSTPSSIRLITPPPELKLPDSFQSSSSTPSPDDDLDDDDRCSLPPVPVEHGGRMAMGSVPSLPAMLAQSQSEYQRDHHHHHHLHHERAPSTPARLALGGGVSGNSSGNGGRSLPQTPISRRKSMSFLTMSGLGSRSGSRETSSSPSGSNNNLNNNNGTNSPTPSARALRVKKKPSLTLLFNKRSQSSLGSSGLNISAPSPYAGPPLDMTMNLVPLSPRSPRSPLSPVSPASDRFSHPPRLETPIDSTPFTYDVSGEDEDDGDADTEEGPAGLPSVSSALTVKHQQQIWRASSTTARARATTVSETPIADHYSSSRAASTTSLASTLEAAAVDEQQQEQQHQEQERIPLSPTRRLTLARAQTHAGLATMSVDRLGLNGLSMDDLGEEEDWARSVLVAADANEFWRVNGSVA